MPPYIDIKTDFNDEKFDRYYDTQNSKWAYQHNHLPAIFNTILEQEGSRH